MAKIDPSQSRHEFFLDFPGAKVLGCRDWIFFFFGPFWGEVSKNAKIAFFAKCKASLQKMRFQKRSFWRGFKI